MQAKRLIKILDLCGRPPLLDDFQIEGITSNSKEVRRGFVFVAIKGTREDGCRFIQEAINRGAGCVVRERSSGRETRDERRGTPIIEAKDARRALAALAAEFYGHPCAKIKVVGVTGTNGKTTVSYLLEKLLKKAGSSPGVIGTVNQRFKNKVIASKNTTPGPGELQSLLAEMAGKGVDFAVVEVSSHALVQERTGGVNFHSAIFTNLSRDHLDYHRDLESYFRAKAKLFQGLHSDAFAVLNYDDGYGRRLKKLTRAVIIGYGIKEKAEVMAERISFGRRETNFILKLGEERLKINSGLIGRHNIYNLLAAAAWGYQADFSPQVIQSALSGCICVPGRLERIGCRRGFSVFVDYAHTEDALRKALVALRPLARKKLIVVFGCGGERDKGKRPKMGQAAASLSDYAIITSDNPRSEEPQAIFKDIKKGISGKDYCIIPERREAIEKALLMARRGDIVLIAGKGHEDYQLLKDRRIHFDDRQVARECLGKSNY